MNIPQKYRAYTYRVLVSASPLLVSYGVLSDDKAALWSGLALALFGLPAKNTPTS